MNSIDIFITLIILKDNLIFNITGHFKAHLKSSHGWVEANDDMVQIRSKLEDVERSSILIYVRQS